MTEKRAFHHLPIRILLLPVCFTIMAFGVAFSIKAGLGTSPISSVPYVTSEISGLSVGVTTIIMNVLFVLIQILILRKRYEWFQLLQIPASIFFGLMIDVAEMALEGIPVPNYFVQWLLCIAGIVLLALGVSMEVMVNLITNAGEGIVLAICQVFPKLKFSYMKVAFDVTLVLLSIILSFAFLGQLVGVREGTIAAAIFVGLVTKVFKKPLTFLKESFLNRERKQA